MTFSATVFLRHLEDNFWHYLRDSSHPSIFQHDYLHHIALYEKLLKSFTYIREAAKKTKFEIIDVGCGNKPYLEVFQPYAQKYIGVDIDPKVADVVAPAEKLPFGKASFDLVLCFQTLEHCEEPKKVIAEMHRVLRSEGFVILSTHGAWMYHPTPHYYHRWTNEGLEKLFRNFSVVKVLPMLPWLASIIQLINIELYSIACRYLVWKLPLYAMITVLNVLGRLFIHTGLSHFTINYVVTAKKKT